IALLAATPVAVTAQTAESAAAPASGAFVPQAERLDKLFDELKREGNPDSAKAISQRIQREWHISGSATIDLLMQWAEKASSENRNGAALDFLDETVRLAPDYAEGWNRRATLHFKMGNY